MARTREWTRHEKETLIFNSPEQAKVWSESVNENLRQQETDGMRRSREIVADAVAEEFNKQGTPVVMVREPWTHTPAEHEEAQHLVDMAFAQDLPAAIKKAKESRYYPRNLDLFHDVLTGEMYDLVVAHALNRQSLLPWVIFAVVGVALAVFLVLIILFFI